MMERSPVMGRMDEVVTLEVEVEDLSTWISIISRFLIILERVIWAPVFICPEPRPPLPPCPAPVY
jgi:hypothetical protein